MDLSKRLTSLDILRGLTIAGMILVNDPGSWAHVYPPLRHAVWHGITPTDFVFPFFVFIVGVSIVLAYTKRLKSNVAHGPLIRKILIRGSIIFVMGLFLWLFPKFDWAGIRIPGVLQRIAIAFVVCALLFLKTSWRTQAIFGVSLLLAYWLVMILVPVPIDEAIRLALESGQMERSGGQMIPISGLKQISEGFIGANLEPGTNLAAWMDRTLVPGRLWEKNWDPEGLLSTLPAIGTGITGMMAGHILLTTYKKEEKTTRLFVLGFCYLALGNVWDWFFPFNKNLWSSSFVLYTAGLATLTLAATYWWVDVRNKSQNNRFFFLCRVFGANAITAYLLHGIMNRVFDGLNALSGFHPKTWFMSTGTGLGISPEFVSLSWAITYTLFIYLFVWIMYRRKIFLKV